MTDAVGGHWARLAGEARAGELYLDDEMAAQECLKACVNRINDLRGMLQLVDQAKNVTGFGDFDMAEQLRKKFFSQATSGENSVDAVILEHIEAVENMRDVMAISIARIRGQDYTNATAITEIIDAT
ncbi:hypothetical protein [Nocardia sp. NPDC047654]|uniref:hypothetical protein n=1 Tax=Nocardia sp. NPDC047654 TaxID=3364314 RepID=UPI00371C0341